MTDQDKIDAVTVALNGHDPENFYPPWRTSDGKWTVLRVTGGGEIYAFRHEKDAQRFYKTGVAPNYDAAL